MYPKSNVYGTAVLAAASSVQASAGMFAAPTENAHPTP